MMFGGEDVFIIEVDEYYQACEDDDEISQRDADRRLCPNFICVCMYVCIKSFYKTFPPSQTPTHINTTRRVEIPQPLHTK